MSLKAFGESLLNEPRDLPLLSVWAQSALYALVGVALFFVGDAVVWLAPVYLLIWGFCFLDRFTLMLHNVSHRPFFKPRLRVLNRWAPDVVGLFFGQTPSTYFAHHVGMHHREENAADDLSTTLPFKRDRLDHFALYLGRFMFLILLELPRYHWQRGRARLAFRAASGELFFLVLVGVLATVNLPATMVVFIIPFLLVRTLMMAGNWGQHAFIDPEDPHNPHRSVTTCIECRYNRRCFNDGYHLGHHLYPRLHYSEHPGRYEEDLETLGQRDAVVFKGIDFFMIWFFLVFRMYGRLADAFVHLPGAPERSRDEIIDLLKSRIVPVAEEKMALPQASASV